MTDKKSIIITGATSGIGKHLVQLLAKRGWTIFAGYRKDIDREKLEKIKGDIRPIKIDITDTNDILNAKKDIIKSKIPLHAIINNAGVGFGGPVECIPLDKFKYVLDVNLFGTISMIQEFLPLLRENKGRIVIMGSIAGFIPAPFMQPYVTSKFSLRALSEGLDIELANQGVHISLIEAGPFKTPLWEKSIQQTKSELKDTSFYRNEIDQIEKNIKKYRFLFSDVKRINKTIIHAIEAKKPHLRYIAYKNIILDRLLFRLTPNCIKKAILKLIFRG